MVLFFIIISNQRQTQGGAQPTPVSTVWTGLDTAACWEMKIMNTLMGKLRKKSTHCRYFVILI